MIFAIFVRNTFLLKYVFVILAISGILAQNMSKLIILVNFQLNRDYIAKKLCVKKNEKGNCCQGSCQLKKQIDEDNKKEQAPPNSLKDMKEFQQFCEKKPPFNFNSPLMFERDFISYQFAKTKSVVFAIFHPPCILS